MSARNTVIATCHGLEGVRFFTKLKTVTSNWPRAGNQSANYAMPVQK